MGLFQKSRHTQTNDECLFRNRFVTIPTPIALVPPDAYVHLSKKICCRFATSEAMFHSNNKMPSEVCKVRMSPDCQTVEVCALITPWHDDSRRKMGSMKTDLVQTEAAREVCHWRRSNNNAVRKEDGTLIRYRWLNVIQINWSRLQEGANRLRFPHADCGERDNAPWVVFGRTMLSSSMVISKNSGGPASFPTWKLLWRGQLKLLWADKKMQS